MGKHFIWYEFWGVLVTFKNKSTPIGRLRRAPENFVTQQFADEVYEHGLNETRRGFLRKSFVTALGATAAGSAIAADGEKVILEKQQWQILENKSLRKYFLYYLII